MKHRSFRYFTIPSDAKVTYNVYTYAELDNVFMEIKRNASTGIRLEETLNIHCGRYSSVTSLTMDLVFIYSVELPSGAILYIRCIDNLIQIGNGIKIIKE